MALDILNSAGVVDSTKSDFATFGAVHLDVTEVERSLAGNRLLLKSSSVSLFGNGGNPS